MDFTKPITRKKISGTPAGQSGILLRIKELGEASASVAALNRESYFEGADTPVIKETEWLKTVKYGEEFTVYAKMQAFDSPFSVDYGFITADKSKPKAQNFCTECGAEMKRRQVLPRMRCTCMQVKGTAAGRAALSVKFLNQRCTAVLSFPG